METLLKKVESIESEAQKLIQETEQKFSSTLDALRAREDAILTETRTKALARGKEIMTEQVTGAEKDINAIKQQGERSAEIVHQVAEKNRPSAIELVKQLVTEEYGA